LLAQTKPDSHNTKSLIVFLKALKRFVQGQQVILIGDHLPAHRSKVMKRFLFEQRDWLPIEWLRGYAPDLNPTEGVWNNIKGREMANFCPDHMDEAVTAFSTWPATGKALAKALVRLSVTRGPFILTVCHCIMRDSTGDGQNRLGTQGFKNSGDAQRLPELGLCGA
jgi:transposase